jgi:hypothetical protein
MDCFFEQPVIVKKPSSSNYDFPKVLIHLGINVHLAKL